MICPTCWGHSDVCADPEHFSDVDDTADICVRCGAEFWGEHDCKPCRSLICSNIFPHPAHEP